MFHAVAKPPETWHKQYALRTYTIGNVLDQFKTMSKNRGKFKSSLFFATSFICDMSLWLHRDEYDCTNLQNKEKQVQEHKNVFF